MIDYDPHEWLSHLFDIKGSMLREIRLRVFVPFLWAAAVTVAYEWWHWNIPLADRQWGARSRGAYAFKSLLQRGTVVAFGSDVPVATLDPRQGVYAAMERETVKNVSTPHSAMSETNTARTGSKASALRKPSFGTSGCVCTFVTRRGPTYTPDSKSTRSGWNRSHTSS